jgi:hypothetical protein
VGAAGRVISFKSSICAFPVLQQNIALNGFKNVFAFPLALTQESGKQLIFAAGRGGTLSSIKSSPAVGNVVAIYGGMREKPGHQVERRATNP